MRNCELSPHRLAQRSHVRSRRELRGIIAPPRSNEESDRNSFRISNDLVIYVHDYVKSAKTIET